MSGITSVSVRKRRRRLAGRRRRLMSAVFAAIGLLALIPVIGLAVHDNGMFELDGNIKHDSLTTPPYDWASLFNSSGNRIITPPSGALLADDFLPDFVNPDSTYFSSNGAGVKDIDAISNWGCTTIHNPTAKDNLLNAYAALVQVPSGPTAGHFVLYVGSERESNNGTSFAGFWLFKNSVTCNPLTGTFSGSHTDGDILVVSNYTNGGGNQEVELFQEQSGVLTPVANGGVCGSAPNASMVGMAMAPRCRQQTFHGPQATPPASKATPSLKRASISRPCWAAMFLVSPSTRLRPAHRPSSPLPSRTLPAVASTAACLPLLRPSRTRPAPPSMWKSARL